MYCRILISFCRSQSTPYIVIFSSIIRIDSNAPPMLLAPQRTVRHGILGRSAVKGQSRKFSADRRIFQIIHVRMLQLPRKCVSKYPLGLPRQEQHLKLPELSNIRVRFSSETRSSHIPVLCPAISHALAPNVSAKLPHILRKLLILLALLYVKYFVSYVAIYLLFSSSRIPTKISSQRQIPSLAPM